MAKLTKEKKAENPRKNMEHFINNVILDDIYSERFAKAVSAIATDSAKKEPPTPAEEKIMPMAAVFGQEKESFIFKSKTKKASMIENRNVPGPGEYMLNTKHKIYKKLP